MLGPVGVRLGEAGPVAPRGERPREVLAVLCIRRGRPTPAATILDLVWDDAAPMLDVGVVHTVVGRLRRQFGADLVHRTDAGYLLGSGAALDTDRFDELAGALRTAPAEDPLGRRERLCREALALWAGDTAYDGVREELVRPERVRLAELRRAVRMDLASGLLDAGARPESPGATAEALSLAQDLLAANPVDEDAAVLCMRAAYRLGRAGHALRVFDTLRRTLRAELGIDPGVAARKVHARILAQDATLDGVGHRDSPGGRRLPVPVSPTVGRERERSEVLGALRAGRRLVTVTGPAGVGKSRMLADVGAALPSGTPVAHVSVGAHTRQSAPDLAGALAVTSGVPLGGADAVAALVRSLRSRQLVVLVDEAEWAPEATATLASAVLGGAPMVQLVVASRVPLNVLGERLVELAPLPLPDPAGPVESLRSCAAVRLLLERLVDRGVAPDPDPTAWSAQELRAVAGAVVRLDGLPLAIELLAAAAGAEPGRELGDLLRVERPLELRSTDRGREERHESLRGALAWSVGRLDPDTRAVLARLSVFAGRFSAAAARGVVDYPPADVDRAVQHLAGQHLVGVERVCDRVYFRLLRTVRELAREELVGAGHEQSALLRHQAWFAGMWRDAPLSDGLVEHVGDHYDDYLEAMTGALGRGADDVAADIATTLCRRWLFIEASGPGQSWTGAVLERRGITAGQRARLQIAAAGFANHLDLSPEGHDRMVTALVADPDWTCLLLLMEAIAAYVAGDLSNASTRLAEAMRVSTAGAPHHLPELTATRAVVAAAAGDHELAVAGAHQALARVGESLSAVHQVTVIPKIALALLDAGRPAEALDLLERSCGQAHERFGIEPTPTTATNAGWAALALDRAEVAAGWFTRALVGPQAFEAPGAVGEAAAGLGAARAESDPAGAGELLELGLLLLEEAGQTLPRSLRDRIRSAASRLGPPATRTGWTPDLAVVRVRQLAARAGAGHAEAP